MEFIRPAGRLVQALALVAGLTVQGQALAGDAAQQAQVLDVGVLLAEAEGAGGGDDRAGQPSCRREINMQVCSSVKHLLCVEYRAVLADGTRGRFCVWQVQPRQAPKPQAIFFSRLARQGTSAAAQSLATPRIITIGPQVSTMS